MKDLNAATLQDFKDFYKTYYSPNNSVLTVAGDINIGRTKSLIEKYYGDIPPQDIPELKKIDEPIQQGHRSVTLKKDVQSTTFMLGFQGPSVNDEDLPAMEILSYILGNGDSSRLHQKLVYNQQLANETWAFAYSLAIRGAFLVNVAVKPGQNVDSAINSVYAEIYKTRTEKVSEEELTKARNMLISELVGRLKTAHGKAYALAGTEVVAGDYNRLFSDIARYAKVTPEDVLNVAKKYLTPNQRSIVRVVPKS
ncbi:MAG: pitrilysin family protein [Bdellovibrionales bacterium]